MFQEENEQCLFRLELDSHLEAKDPISGSSSSGIFCESLCDFLSSRWTIHAKEIRTSIGQVGGRDSVVMIRNKTHFSSIVVSSQ